MSAISLIDVWKEYAGRVVLERVNVEIASGAFVALVGPSGCGKTTLLRMLLSEERPSRGRILLDGMALPPEPSDTRGVVFQRYSVFPHLTALANVRLALELAAAPLSGRLFGAGRRAATARALTALTEVGLGERAEAYPAQMSGGMQQRLALAQALIRRPKVLLLDEPFGALDPGIRADIHVLMQGLWRESGTTIVMVTHDLSEAFRLASRVIALERPQAGGAKENVAKFGARVTHDIEVWPRKRHLATTQAVA